MLRIINDNRPELKRKGKHLGNHLGTNKGETKATAKATAKANTTAKATTKAQHKAKPVCKIEQLSFFLNDLRMILGIPSYLFLLPLAIRGIFYNYTPRIVDLS